MLIVNKIEAAKANYLNKAIENSTKTTVELSALNKKEEIGRIVKNHKTDKGKAIILSHYLLTNCFYYNFSRF